MSDEIKTSYDAAAKRAVITFPNGRELTLDNVTEEQAKDFRRKHAAEFQKRDCVLHTAEGHITREGK